MKCIIPGANLKIFARAIHSLSKIGDEIYLEALPDGLSMRTVNSSRSAYACFKFVPTFFLKYDGQCNTQKNTDDSFVSKCKITTKSCLTVFKSLVTLEKTVERCRLVLDVELDRLVFQLHCKHGIVKTYNLSFIECENLQAVFSKDFSPNVLVSQSRLFHDVVGNFQSGQEEITLSVTPERVMIRNYIDDEPDPQKVIRTELSLMPEEFENYRVGVDTEVTFCLKELRALLSFSESSNLPLSMYFESAGRPIILALDSDPSFEANFVLATLADTGTQVSSSQQSMVPMVSKAAAASKKNQPGRGKLPQTRKPPSVEAKTKKDGASFQRKLSNTFGPKQSSSRMMREFESTTNGSETVTKSNLDESALKEVDIADVSTAFEESNGINDQSKNLPTKPNEVTAGQIEKRLLPSASDKPGSIAGGESPVIPAQHTAFEKVVPTHSKPTVCESNASEDDETDDDDDLVPGTPPNKRFRSLFFGVSQSTTSGSQPTTLPPPLVLAEDSEDENDK